MAVPSLADLRRTNLDQMQKDASETSPVSETSPSNEGLKIPSNDEMSARVKDSTPEGVHEGTSARANVPALQPTSARKKVGAKVGTGEDWLTDILTKANGATEEKGATSRLNVDIDDDLHRRLKMHCLANKTTLRKLVPVLLTAYLEKAGDS